MLFLGYTRIRKYTEEERDAEKFSRSNSIDFTNDCIDRHFDARFCTIGVQ